MKPFPIRVEKYNPMDYKFIEYELHNVCTYNCSFCSSDYKDGSKRWKTLEEYKSDIDKIVLAANGSPCFIQLTGGEPTLFPDVIELMQYIRSKNAHIGMISNGVRTIRWWKELRDANVLDKLSLSFHSEQTSDYQKIIDITLLFHDSPVNTLFLITHVGNTLKLAFEAFNAAKKQTGSIIIVKAMMGQTNTYDPELQTLIKVFKNNTWTDGDLRRTKKLANIPFKMGQLLKITHENGDISRLDPQSLMKSKNNNFNGWTCYVGEDSMRINVDQVFRGVCGEGGITHLTTDPQLKFSTSPIICTKNSCFCGTDMVSTKVKTIISNADK